MGFVYEVVPEEDGEFFNSMELKNCWGGKHKMLTKHTKWCADREKNAYLVGIGGGYQDMPHFYDLWWNGHIIRMEVEEGGKGNADVGVEVIWKVKRIPIPKEIWQYKEEILKMIEEAFAVDSSWCKPNIVKSITVKIECEAEIVEDKYAVLKKKRDVL